MNEYNHQWNGISTTRNTIVDISVYLIETKKKISAQKNEEIKKKVESQEEGNMLSS